MIPMCIIASREEIHRETTIASTRAPGSMALRDSLDLPDPLTYSLISARYSIADLYTHTHTHTCIRPVKFYGSGCPERFLDYTHLKKIPHESLQRRRVFTRRLHFSDVSVNSPLSIGRLRIAIGCRRGEGASPRVLCTIGWAGFATRLSGSLADRRRVTIRARHYSLDYFSTTGAPPILRFFTDPLRPPSFQFELITSSNTSSYSFRVKHRAVTWRQKYRSFVFIRYDLFGAECSGPA